MAPCAQQQTCAAPQSLPIVRNVQCTCDAIVSAPLREQVRTWLAVLETLQPLNCSARDELVIGPTGFDPMEAETVEVGSCSASTVRLAKPLVHAHYGAQAVPSLGSQQVTLPAGLCQLQSCLDHDCHLICVHLA